MTNHPNRAARYALIVADPNTDELGEIVSRHRSRRAAEAAKQTMDVARWRWAYVAERKLDGSWPLRCEA